MKIKIGFCVWLVLLTGCGAVTSVERPEQQTMSFVVMGDNRPANEFRPEQPYIYHKVVASAVALHPDLILNTGDVVLGYDADSVDKAAAEFTDFEKATTAIREKEIPLYITMGNHSGYTEFARAAFAQRYTNKATHSLYYSVDKKNSHFVVLCSELENQAAQITGQQLEWLKGDLKRARAEDKHIFVLLHRPLYPKIEHLEDSMNANPANRDELAGLFKKYQVDMVFVGHVHIYNFSVVANLSQIIAGGSGAPLVGNLNDGAFNHFFQVLVDGDAVDYRLLPLQNEVALATQFMEEGRLEGAISLAQKAIEILPDHPMPHLVATAAYKAAGLEGEYNEGIAKLLPILETEAEVYFRLGEFSLAAKQLDLADLFLTKAQALDANSFKILYHYAGLKKVQRQYPAALKTYKKALPLTDNLHRQKEIKAQIEEIEKDVT